MTRCWTVEWNQSTTQQLKKQNRTATTIHKRGNHKRGAMALTHGGIILFRMFRDQTEGRFALRETGDVFVASFDTSLAILHVPHIQF